jgi:hypothetical protein
MTLPKQQSMNGGERVKGVRLLGWDIPTVITASEEKLRVIAAVECCDPSLAPSVVAVVVRYEVKTSVFVFDHVTCWRTPA